MHDDTDGALVSYNGHTLTADEFHAAVYALLALPIGANAEMSGAIRKEPHYFLGGLVVAYLIGRRLRQ